MTVVLAFFDLGPAEKLAIVLLVLFGLLKILELFHNRNRS